MRQVSMWAAWAVAGLAAGSAQAQYTVTQIAPTSTAVVNIAAAGMNDSGQVVGTLLFSDGISHAFVTGADGIGLRDLGSLDGSAGSSSWGRGINNAGQVVGSSTAQGAPGHLGFVTDPGAHGMTSIGTLGGDYNTSDAYAINNAGQVAGSSGISLPGKSGERAVLTDTSGAHPRDLGSFGGRLSRAYGVNDAGQVVGWADTRLTAEQDGGSYAFLSGANGGALTRLSGDSSGAVAVNAAGEVVGYSYPKAVDPDTHAFATGPNGTGWTDLGAINGAGSSGALDVDSQGRVVGWITLADGYHAFVSGVHGTGLYDLNSLLPAEVTAKYGHAAFATAINERGQILVELGIPEEIGLYGSSPFPNLRSEYTAFLLTPTVAEPDTLALAALGLSLALVRRQRRKPHNG